MTHQEKSNGRIDGGDFTPESFYEVTHAYDAAHPLSHETNDVRNNFTGATEYLRLLGPGELVRPILEEIEFSDRDIDIITSRMDGETLDNLASKHGISREGNRRVLARGARKLQEHFKRYPEAIPDPRVQEAIRWFEETELNRQAILYAKISELAGESEMVRLSIVSREVHEAGIAEEDVPPSLEQLQRRGLVKLTTYGRTDVRDWDVRLWHK